MTEASTGLPTSPPLIVGDVDDEHVQAVMSEIRPGHAPLVLNVAALESSEFALCGETLRLGDVELSFEHVVRGWIRRLAPPHWRRGSVSGSRDAAVRSAWLGMLVGICGEPNVDWVTPYARLISSENKLVQARVAKRMGIDTPASVVSSDISKVPDFFGDTLLVKPLGIGNFLDADGEARVVWAQTLQRDDVRFEALCNAPFLIQETLRARRHLRIVTVGRRSWACVLDAAGLPVDWRAHEDAHHSFQSTAEPETQSSAVALAARLGLGYSSQDWIDTGDRAVFIDLNPAGQWLFLPSEVSAAVAASIASHLEGAG